MSLQVRRRYGTQDGVLHASGNARIAGGPLTILVLLKKYIIH
jgi:hypothetical protein